MCAAQERGRTLAPVVYNFVSFREIGSVTGLCLYVWEEKHTPFTLNMANIIAVAAGLLLFLEEYKKEAKELSFKNMKSFQFANLLHASSKEVIPYYFIYDKWTN